MRLKYSGPKPIISHTGIDFDRNKEDKYVYLNVLAQLIKALDHDYIEDKSYVYEEKGRLNESEVFDILKEQCPNIKEVLDERFHNIEDEIEDNLLRAQENRLLSDEDKEVLINNIEMMREYMVQRSINKSVYYCAMQKLAEIVARGHIGYITMPMFEPFMHVLHSLQGTLLKEKAPIDTKLDVYQEDKKLFVKLQVVNILRH